jgi:hypothetical protein
VPKAVSLRQEDPTKGFGFDGELVLMALPVPAFKQLSDIAAKINKTVAEVFQEAISAYLDRVAK